MLFSLKGAPLALQYHCKTRNISNLYITFKLQMFMAN